MERIFQTSACAWSVWGVADPTHYWELKCHISDISTVSTYYLYHKEIKYEGRAVKDDTVFDGPGEMCSIMRAYELEELSAWTSG